MSESIVTFDEFNTEVTPEEYAAFCERQKEQSYINEATLDENGVPISVDYYIVKGTEILASVMAEG